MSQLRVNCFTISLDGYGAGPDQSLDNPLGVGGDKLHQWMTSTRTFQQMFGNDGGTTGVDDDFTARGLEGVGAWILGRNMFSSTRGEWPDDGWRGWWGDDPPYHAPVYIVTNHPRDSIVMEGGTTFHFITAGIDAALSEARSTANGLDVRIGGGVDLARQYCRGGLIDEIHLAISPIVLGSGESLFADLDLYRLGYRVVEHVPTQLATHIVLRKV